jgi:T-complex protein 1 subunit epsilon
MKLLEKGIHPLKIASGFDKASDFVVKHLDTLKEEKECSERETLIEAAKIALSSKVVSKYK